MGAALFWQGEFYVMGGETSSGPGATPQDVYDRVDVYDPETNLWRLDAPLPVPRHGIRPVLFEGRMFLPGGGVQKGNSQSTALDAFTRSSSARTRSIAARSNAARAVARRPLRPARRERVVSTRFPS